MVHPRSLVPLLRGDLGRRLPQTESRLEDPLEYYGEERVRGRLYSSDRVIVKYGDHDAREDARLHFFRSPSLPTFIPTHTPQLSVSMTGYYVCQ